MIKRILFALILVAAIVGALVYTKMGQFKTMGEAGANMVPPPETVTASPVEQMQWEQTLASTGTLSPVQGVTVSAEAGGRVKTIRLPSALNTGKYSAC